MSIQTRFGRELTQQLRGILKLRLKSIEQLNELGAEIRRSLRGSENIRLFHEEGVEIEDLQPVDEYVCSALVVTTLKKIYGLQFPRGGKDLIRHAIAHGRLATMKLARSNCRPNLTKVTLDLIDAELISRFPMVKVCLHGKLCRDLADDAMEYCNRW